MALGVCCHWIRREVTPRSEKIKIINELEERTLQLGRWQRGLYSDTMMSELYEHNARGLLRVLETAARAGIKLFRVSSALFPLSDKVPRHLYDSDKVKKILEQAGRFATSRGIRLTTHPGQFCVLSSDSDAVIEKSIIELEHHAWMFDVMGLPRSPHAAINIHGGKADRASRLIDVINGLSPSVRSRLTLENDENCYSVAELLPVSLATGVPIVWDSHHHTFNDDNLSMDEAADACDETWPSGILPLQHISNTEPALRDGNIHERRKHSDLIHHIPDAQLKRLRSDRVDLEVEAKLKNIAVLEMPAKFGISL